MFLKKLNTMQCALSIIQFSEADLFSVCTVHIQLSVARRLFFVCNDVIENLIERLFSQNFFQNVNYLILKYLCKFQLDTPINTRIIAVQSLENLYTFYRGTYDSGQENAHQPTFPYNIIQNPPTSLDHTFVFIGPNSFTFGTETRCTVL